MLTSVIVSVVVLVGAIGFLSGRRPPWALQPATATVSTGTASRSLRSATFHRLTPLDEEDDTSIVMDSLRALGIVRRRIERPVVGRKAYVRMWERVRALVILAAIIVSVGIAVAATVGVLFLALGFLLEQAIS